MADAAGLVGKPPVTLLQPEALVRTIRIDADVVSADGQRTSRRHDIVLVLVLVEHAVQPSGESFTAR